MAVVVCPRCNAPNDARSDAAGRMSCVICNHQWVPSATAAAAPGPAPAPAPIAKRSRPAATISQEYLPDDPASEAPKALTTRQSAEGNPPARAANRAREGAGGGAAELKPHSDRSHGGVIPPLKALPAKDPTPPQGQQPLSRHPLVQGTPRVTPSTPTVEVDMDLFDRLEKEAQVNRSKQQTVAEITFAPPDAANAASSAGGQTLACPVCGHSFIATTSARAQTCPQCHTTFDHASGRFATLEGNGGDPLIGRNLRGCVIDRKLGEGGMGSVYHARQLSLDRSVAIKVLPPDLARNRNFIQRFEREAKSLAKINHPNILHIYDFGEEASLKLYFMIIEFVDGTDLGEVLNRRTTLPQLEVLDLLRQAAMGLEMAAAKGVIHRDIKPDNLMIAADGTCKVSDFGLAKGYGDENEVTSVGVRVGTPAFMSPEQCDGIEVDWRSDVYNLGCTAFLCLTGKLPFDGETPFSIMLKHKNEPIPSVRDVSPSVEPAVDRLIKQLLAKKPADRCDSWRSLVDEIESIEVQLSGDPNIMRKSRGQLQALSKPPAAAPARTPERLPTPPPLRTASSSAARVPEGATLGRSSAPASPAVAGGALPEWLRPVEVPMPVATAAPAVASPLPNTRKSSEMRAPVVGQRPSPTASDPRAERISKRLNVELASAKDRGLRTEAEALVASADRLEAAGRFDEAAKDLRKAAERMPDEQEALALRQRAKEVRLRGRWRRVLRRMVSLLVVLVALFLALWLGTPQVHNLLADRALREILAEDNPARRAASLNNFLATTKPWPWYVAIFPKGYPIGPLAEAQHELDQLNPKTPVQVQPQENPAVNRLEALVMDPASTWPDISDQASQLLHSASGKDRQRVQNVLDQALSAVATMTAELRRIEAAAANGQARDALAAAATFRTMHPRAGRLAQGLPLPGRVAAHTEDGTPIDVSLRVDGQPLPPGTNVFVRRADRDEILEIAARGFASVRQTIPADAAADERVVTVTMQVAPIWTIALGRGLGGPATLRPAADGLYVQRLEGVALLSSTNGQQLATLEPLPGMQGPSYTGLWINDQAQNRLLVASTDGAVRALDPRSLACVEVLHKGPAPVLAWLDIPLTYQAGMRSRYLIEENRGNRRLAALKGDQEWWSYQALRGNLVPQLMHVGDQVLVIDDTTVHFLEEDGSNVQPKDLPAPRTGPALTLAQDSGIVMPTATGVEWVRFGKHDQPLVVVDDKALLAVGPGQLVLDGRLLVIAHADAVEALQLDGDHFTSRWRTALDSPPVALAAGEGVVAVANAKNRLLLFSSGTGEHLMTITLVNRPAGPPLVRSGLVVVADSEGVVSAYALPRTHDP